jgi:CHAT domain-containing protein/tetratricopeptide (TPR) repeat protein
LLSNPNGHIGTAELAKLLEESRRSAEPLDAADVHLHLAACLACREQFEELASLDRQLESIRPAESRLPQGDCPGQAVWHEIAGGVTSPSQTLTYIEHASRCDYCGPQLRGAVAELTDLNGEITEAERKHILTLESARAEWQQQLAQRITATQHSRPDRGSTPWRSWLAVPRLAMVGASLLVLAVVGSWVVVYRNRNDHRHQPAYADKLLARAYTDKRTLELRIAGAGYAPLRVSRGSATSFTSRPDSLLRAEALIASQLESHPSDPSWLQAKAQADVLEGKYDAAVEALRRALELQPHSPAILTDLATAYFQRAQQDNRKEDLGAAYEYLSQALQLQPDDSVALFNRAIIAEHQYLYQQALDDWEHYLRVDAGSEWAAEARDRANAVRETLKEHGGKATPLLSPAQLAAMASNPSLGSDQRSEVDQHIEEYLHEAVRSWLPLAFPEARDNADPRATQALFFLADLTRQQHGDRWLDDLLHSSSASHFPQAITALALALKANDAGEYSVSRQQADLAEQWFRASGNMAGVLRAQFEQTFAAQIERHSEQCRRKATAALTESEKHSYPWLQIQLSLEEGVCSGLMSDLGTDERAAQGAVNQAQKSGYGTLYLRALGFIAGDRFAAGDSSGGWKLANAGLERYWSGQFPAMRGYNLYTDVAYAAGAAGQSNLQLAIWREAVTLIDSDEDLLLRASARVYLASAAVATHQPQVAEQQYAEAARLYSFAPRTPAVRANRLENEILTARLEARQKSFDAAIVRLTSIQDQVLSLSNNYLVQMFYSTLGELQLDRHREAEAEQALRPALALAEQNLASIRSEAERGAWSKNTAAVYLGLSEAELVEGRSQDAFEMYEWYLGAPQRVATDAGPHRSRYPSMTNPPEPDPSRLASRLPLTKETVLAYAALPDGLAIWVYDDRGTVARWIPTPTGGLQELAARFHDLSSDPKSELSALRRDARSLYVALIAPVEQQLAPGRTLVIEAEGWLARVPFEALLDSSDHYLIERAPIVHSLGRDSDARLRKDGPISADLPALVVGSAASSQAEGLVPLPDVAAEADTVARGFHSARVLKGGEATLSALRSELPAAAVFHFAGHALAAPERSGLLLDGGDGKANIPRLMGATVVRQLRLQSLQLAVLSACSTASGSGGSGFDSVTDALLRAGVPHVVASRWAVDSTETRGFVQDFYRNALSGQTVSDAIRLTSRNMLANPRTSHPYYWSAFAAYGRP